ncbi:MAG TPA: hypothetical protein VMY38_06720 [Gemmatimonadaceae bacterium]|nr:hypothetical protein [Gemmatimonadaceae bacterium]
MRSTLNKAIATAAIMAVSGACGSSDYVGDPGYIPPPQASIVPLTDMGTATYLGFPGGLYPGGAKIPPARHDSVGRARARAVQPLDVNGNVTAAGKYVLLSIGMSNTTQEFCSGSSAPPCDSWTFVGQALADAAVEKTSLELVNGAAGGRTASAWDSPVDTDYDRIRDTRLAPRGLSEQQVQIVWVKVANAQPSSSLPAGDADAYLLVAQMGNIARALKTRYPNVRQVFFSNRIYAGYAVTTLNPEPYAYESGFAVKWAVQAQIDQKQTGTINVRAGNLNYDGVAPWIAWGPDLWAAGETARSDGLFYTRNDLVADGTHPSQSGQQKVGRLLLDFFKGSAYTGCWFLAAGSC